MEKLKEYIKRKKISKRVLIFIIVSTLLFGMMGIAYNNFIVGRQASMSITFKYEGAEKGINPDGSKFNISELKNEEILNEVVEKMGNTSLTVEDLEKRIFITSKISKIKFDNVSSTIIKGGNTSYIPTTYYIYYSQGNKIGKNQSQEVLACLESVYKDYFDRKYSEKNNILEFDSSTVNFNDCDYMEAYQLLKDKSDSMLTYINKRYSEDKTFEENETGLSYTDAITKLQNFQDLTLAQYKTYVIQNKISKDTNEYLQELSTLITDEKRIYDKLSSASEIAQKIIEEYNKTMTANAFVISQDQDGYYMSKPDTGIDMLTQKSYNYGLQAKDIQKTIEENQYLYDKFSDTEESSGSIEIAESLLVQSSKELESLSDELLQLDTEYLEKKTSGYYIFEIRDNNLAYFSYLVKGMLIGSFLSFGFIFFKCNIYDKLKLQKRRIKEVINALSESNEGEL